MNGPTNANALLMFELDWPPAFFNYILSFPYFYIFMQGV